MSDEYYDRIMASLLSGTASSRTTLRLLDEAGELHLVAEAVAPGTESMRSGPQINPMEHDTYKYLVDRREPLVQDDCRTGEPRPPESLVSHFNVYAQMLAPVLTGDDFRGTISVHCVGRTRSWSPRDLTHLEQARRDVEGYLAREASGPARAGGRTGGALIGGPDGGREREGG